MKQKHEDANVIMVGDKDVSLYAWSLILLSQPVPYDNFGEIKIQVTRNRIDKANKLVELFKSLGLEETNRKPCTILVCPPNKKPYNLPDAYEITLRKIGALTSW